MSENTIAYIQMFAPLILIFADKKYGSLNISLIILFLFKIKMFLPILLFTVSNTDSAEIFDVPSTVIVFKLNSGDLVKKTINIINTTVEIIKIFFLTFFSF